MRRDAQQNIRLLEIHSGMVNAMFILPVIMPYYRDAIGLTFHDFLIGEAVFAAVLLTFEVPSGWLSDVWKRKYVLALGSLIEVAGFVMLLFADSFLDAILAQAILGVAISLLSGTNTALLYDSLAEARQENRYVSYEGRRNGIGLYTLGGASIFGGLLYSVDPALPVLGSALAQVVAGIVALAMVEPARHRMPVQTRPLADMAATMRYALHGHVEIAAILFFSAALFCATKLLMWIQQPYYMALGIPEIWFGVLMAAGYVLGGASSHFSHRILPGLSNLRALALAWLVTTLVAAGAGAAIGYHGIALLMLGGSLIFGAASPRVFEAINIRVGPERRATILSTASLLRQVAFIPLAIVVGAANDNLGIAAALFTVAAWLVFSGLFLVLWALRKRRPPAD
ncbi:MAG: MFS transporter [Alphaproteobacteria bacterium]|nr:MFS transporter [Alphaproteobacteria bacterium]